MLLQKQIDVIDNKVKLKVKECEKFAEESQIDKNIIMMPFFA